MLAERRQFDVRFAGSTVIATLSELVAPRLSVTASVAW
jgi:bifunctional ADP-heptose synthase (sugar kinase/adenylyltransferase)